MQAVRDAFFNQPIFRQRNLWDKNLFDDDPDTAFAICRRWPWVPEMRIRGGAFRVDFGECVRWIAWCWRWGMSDNLQPLKWQEAARGAVSADLKTWIPVSGFITGDIELTIPSEQPVRYFRLNGSPELVRHVRGSYCGKALDRSRWWRRTSSPPTGQRRRRRRGRPTSSWMSSRRLVPGARGAW